MELPPFDFNHVSYLISYFIFFNALKLNKLNQIKISLENGTPSPPSLISIRNWRRYIKRGER